MLTPEGTDLFPAHAARGGLLMLVPLLAFPVVGAFVAAAAPGLAALQHRSNVALAAAHLVTLGWGTMVAIGALHQMLPAASGVRRDPARLLPVQLTLHALGVVVLAAGFLARSPAVQIAGGGAVTAGILLFLGASGIVIRHRTRTPPILRYAAPALACLGLTVLWGFVLVVNRTFGFWPALVGPAGLAVHLALGLVGWFGLLIVGMSYFLLPRYAGIRPPLATGERAVFAGLAAGIALLMTGAFAGGAVIRAGALAVGAAGLLYAGDLWRHLRAWRPQTPDITRAHWQVMLAETAVLSLGLLGWALDLLPGPGLRWGIAGVVFYLLGWVTLAIAGQLYKITPYLMWHYRFSQGLAALEVSRLPTPAWPRAGLPPFVLLTAAAPTIAAGVLASSRTLCLAGGIAFLAGAGLLALVLGYSWLPAWRAGRRPPASAEPREHA